MLYNQITSKAMPNIPGVTDVKVKAKKEDDDSDEEEENQKKILKVLLCTTIYKEDVRLIINDDGKNTPVKKTGVIGGGGGFGRKPMIGGKPTMGGFGKPKMGGIGGAKPAAASTTNPAAKPATTAAPTTNEFGFNPLIELKVANEEAMTAKADESSQSSTVNVSILAAERDATLSEEYKLKFEYGFKEKAKAAKLRGGKGPREDRPKREKNIINVGGGGAKVDGKKPKPKKNKMINVNAKDGDDEDKQDEKKVVSKMDLNALLGSSKPKLEGGADAGAAPMSLADRMKMMQKSKNPE